MRKVILLLALFSYSNAFAKEIKVTVKGMVCAFCAQGITKKFSAESGVDKVEVSLGKKTVDLALKEGKDVSDETIRRVLTEAGYTVQKIERN